MIGCIFDGRNKSLIIFIFIVIVLLISSCATEEVAEEDFIENDEEKTDNVQEEITTEDKKEQEVPEIVTIEGYDEQVTIIIEKIDISNELPDTILEYIQSNHFSGMIRPSEEPSAPSDGNIFLNVYYSIARTDNILMKFIEELSLYDEEGSAYQQAYFVIGINYIDPTDIRGGYYIPEGAKGYALYEIPEEVTPKILELTYSFFAYLADDNIYEEVEDTRQIEIKLD